MPILDTLSQQVAEFWNRFVRLFYETPSESPAELASLEKLFDPTVSLNVTDADGQVWANGTWQVMLVPTNPGECNLQNPLFQSGSLDASGNASINMIDSPPNTAWQFTVTSASQPTTAFSQNVTILGGPQPVNLVPPAIRLNLCGIPFRVVAYADAEIVNPPIGSNYYNLIALQERVWNGSAWVANGGGGSIPGGNNKDIQFNDSATLGGSDNFTFDKSTGQVVIAAKPSIGTLLLGSTTFPVSTSAVTLISVAGSQDYSQILSNSAKTRGLTYQYVSGTNAFNIFADYYDAGPSADLVFGTYPFKSTQLILRKTGVANLQSFTVSSLPSGVEGDRCYASNGRKVGEGAGAGTGVPVYFSNGSWRVYSTDAAVTQ